MLEEHTPVLIGIAQLLQREDDPQVAKAPLQMMAEAIRAAAEDAGVPSLLDRVQSIRVVQGIWGYANPARALAELLGCGAVETGQSVLGGNHVQMMVNATAEQIAAGERDVVVLTGAECGRTLGRARKAGLELDWVADQTVSVAPDVVYGTSRWTRHEAETAVGLQQAVQYYSLFETALRHELGESVDEHRRRIAELWAGFAEVAAGNPHAWIRGGTNAAEIAEASPANRAITDVYPKLMNANMRVDMASALILCSASTARQLGVPRDRWVFPLAGTEAYDHYFVSERADLHSSPAIRLAGGRVLELAGATIDDVDLVDVYSCFPSAVQIAARELALPLDGSRPLTVTGGLTFHGGPLNNYVMHSIARTAELLRAGAGARALVTANGGMLTKHAFGIYSVEPEREFVREDLQARVDATPRCTPVEEPEGTWTVESAVVNYGVAEQSTKKGLARSATDLYGGASRGAGGDGWGPVSAHLALRRDDQRAWSRLGDAADLERLLGEDVCGIEVEVGAGL